MTIYLHFDAAQLADGCGGLGEVGSTGQLVTMDEIRRWCGTAGSITVRPVIDLNGTRATRGYQPTDVMREQIALRDLTCVFPIVAASRTRSDDRQARTTVTTPITSRPTIPVVKPPPTILLACVVCITC